MKKKIYSVISGTGSCVPENIVKNEHFLDRSFYDHDGNVFAKETGDIINKFNDITAIRERRYVSDNQLASDIGYLAAKDALISAKISKETIDYIIVAHNSGDVRADNRRSDIIPAIASKVKHKLGIKNPDTIPYDVIFGCPGWLHGVIQADYYIKSGDAKNILVIGTETLSRISDPYDRDSMLYADGAGAAVLQAVTSETPVGILAHRTRSDTLNEVNMLRMDESYNRSFNGNNLYLKMDGRKLYEYALKIVPDVVKTSIEMAGLEIMDIKKVLFHQANTKMVDAIVKRLYKLAGINHLPENVLPMILSMFGNSSVATIPTLLDFLLKNRLQGHCVEAKDVILMASVGAGMNINSIVYKLPD